MRAYTLLKQIGQVLEHDIVDEHGVVLIARNTVITEALVRKIGNHTIREDVHLGAEDLQHLVDGSLEAMDEVFFHARCQTKVHLEPVRRHLLPTIRRMAEMSDLPELLRMLRNHDEYTLTHSIGVAVLSTMLGKWLKFDDDKLERLSVAAVLHDVGKAKIPPELLQKPSRLTESEYIIMQRHTVFGYQLLQQTEGISEEQAKVALQHHERIDGSGYPQKLTGGEIHEFAKLVAVTDVFHAMASKRVYKDALPFFQVLSELYEGQFGLFDPVILQTFVSKLLQDLIGTEVLLSDGRRARVVLLNDKEPTRPLVQVGRQFVDLAVQRDIRIVDATPALQTQ
ncbi:HD-GYP domain-containing protein [Alicyclobacillus acidiphilus]|uniref:HD-GYP domain-containing protein n=1 Tax=Alicyclobacillus acidiphilus TaxID=182455 RepID=UPI000829E530|nr:HD-GYP domain-containing protein [Alicyclobacillus acidiphilus]